MFQLVALAFTVLSQASFRNDVYPVVLCGLFGYKGSNAAPVTTEQYRYDVSSSSSDVTSKTPEGAVDSTTLVQTTNGPRITINTSQLSDVSLAIERLQKRIDEQFNKLTLGSNVTMENMYTINVQQQRPVLTLESTEHARQCKTQTLLAAIRKMYGEYKPWCLEMASFIQEDVVTHYLFQTLGTLDNLQSPVTKENTHDVLKTLASVYVQSSRARNVIELLWRTCFKSY